MSPIMGGLEQREGPTPTEGGMTLFCKAGPDGTSVGDCPFAHYVRLVLHEKNLEYDLRPCTANTKPNWLLNQYQGKMPALRHRQECYVESEVITEYLDYFFPSTPPMKPKNTNNHKEWNKAMEAVDGFFPAVANYLKHTPDGDDEDAQLRSHLQAALQTLEEHFASSSSSSSSDTPPTTTTSTTNPLFLVSDHVTLLDCSLIPKLYHLQVGLQGLKQTDRGIQLEQDYPLLHAYMNRMMERKSFQDTMYPAETILWGWGNARSVSAST